ncbi:MAG TPA: beta-1,6-N-acetylglucosaminyltransferase [Solirubrobacteraceae bacterium]|nr:beta-1,6-N-acetylglucosaminyltransferase [Solirubrobacteraceae bacterium]
MSVAYVVLAHRAPGQVARLAERLCGAEDRLFLHVDRRADLGPFRAAIDRTPVRAHVRLARRRFRSRWGGFALLDATLATTEQALQEASFGHVCLVSGDSYPLVPPPTIHGFLERAGERSFMFCSAASDDPPPDRSTNERWYWNGDLRRVTYRHFQLGDRQLHLPNRFVPWAPRLVPPDGMHLLQGSQWWTLSRRAARLAIETFVRRPALRRYFRRVQAPDEWAFQMVLGNSPLAPTIVEDDLHFIRWRDWHAETLTREDLPRITASPKLFARKLDPGDAALPDALDALIAERESDGGATLARLADHHLS